MTLLLLIRHGENDYVKTGKLAGRLSGVHLNQRGQEQARALGEALKDVPLKAIYSSPLDRAMETAARKPAKNYGNSSQKRIRAS
jgi:probable phosphoglycerate mutase